MPEPIRLPKLLSERDAAAALGVSVDTLQRLRKRRAIRYRKIGGRVRYTEADLADYVESQTVETCRRRTDRGESETAGSQSGAGPTNGAGPGTTPPLDRHAAHLLAQRTFGKPN